MKKEDIVNGARVFFLLTRRTAGTIENVKNDFFNVRYDPDDNRVFTYSVYEVCYFELYP